MQIWYTLLPDLHPHLASLSECLSPSERLRAARFSQEKDRLDFILSHGFLRTILGGQLGAPGSAVSWSVGPFGKPHLAEAGHAGAELAFSLSRTSGAAVCAMGRSIPVGIDVERIGPLPDFQELAASVLTPRERGALASLPVSQRERAFQRSWVCKEAILKLEGVGLGVHPGALDAGPGCWVAEPFSLLWEGQRLFLRTFEFAEQYVAALATRSEPSAVQFLRFEGP